MSPTRSNSVSITNDLWVAIIMPDDVAEEKVKALEALGATVERVRPASIVDKKQVRLWLARLGFYFADIPCNVVCRKHASSSEETIVFQQEGPLESC